MPYSPHRNVGDFICMMSELSLPVGPEYPKTNINNKKHKFQKCISQDSTTNTEKKRTIGFKKIRFFSEISSHL